ncbi:predicted protein [Arabidopsis lyrata subsp. lyrata]|uniref:Predicted protein n=1 Tax=Arabidopsis lyrata subsp. lyrata TaxID=81972 RepID=D7L4C9_ARALL|nr:predicted protein [Arabidopsis lyrata subsp. lyrata]
MEYASKQHKSQVKGNIPRVLMVEVDVELYRILIYLSSLISIQFDTSPFYINNV